MHEFLVGMITAPDAEKAAAIGRVLVEERLAACVNIVEPVRSIYRWGDKVEDEREVLMIVKTTRGAFERLRERVLSLHPYETPEVIAFSIAEGHSPYLKWLSRSVE